MDHSLDYVIYALRYHFLFLHDVRMHRETACEKWARHHGISRRKAWSIINDLRQAGAEISYDRSLMRYRITNGFDEKSFREYILSCMGRM